MLKVKRLFCLILLAISPVSTVAQETNQNEAVILIHGFLGAPSDMDDLNLAFLERGYRTYVADYKTRTAGIEELSDEVFGRALQAFGDAEVLHIVTHSMGGLLARSYLERHEIPNLERMVMLAPPNHGSEVAAELGQYEIYRAFSGPAGIELGSVDLHPEKIGDYQLGIIAGTASVNPVFSPILPGPDDGYVALESTPLLGMNDFITVPTSHGFITHNQSAIQETLYFIDHGQFDHEMDITGFPISTEDFREVGAFLDNLVENGLSD